MIAPPLWAAELAAVFWQEAGGPGPFPRSLRRELLYSSFDVTVVELPGLTAGAAAGHLAARCPDLEQAGGGRRLHGCLVARSGGAFLFLDAGDPPDEQAFSLAHELGHFLRHHWRPRRRALEALGPGVLAVLDGLRPPSPRERLHALLRQAPAGGHAHLMGRGPGLGSAEWERAEEEADLLALELLAPAAEVRARLPAGASAGEAEALLAGGFGLPRGPAAWYAGRLCPPAGRAPWLARLGKARAGCRTSGGPGELNSGGPRDESPE